MTQPGRWLSPGPHGVGASAVRHLPGGRGEGLAVGVVERAWSLDHEAFEGLGFSQVAGPGSGDRVHGTAMLGVITGRTGVAPALREVVLAGTSSGRPGPVVPDDVARAVDAAAARLQWGDVLLIEAQLDGVPGPAGARAGLPVLLHPGVAEAVGRATGRGLTVVVPAGNGEGGIGHDLDQCWPPGAPDGGAIVVGGLRARHLDRCAASNHGARVRCAAWGHGVTAPSSRSPVAWGEATGTSAAAALVAGVAAVLQAIVHARRGRALPPGAVRALLCTPALGTPAVDGCGVMPDLAKLAGLSDAALERAARGG